MQDSFPNGIFIGRYKGISFYAKDGEYQCLFGWVPKTFPSIRAIKYNITRYRNS
ncbi:MAG: hypothetical protein ACYCZR_11855 [Burkholderiales bacterium]